MSLLNKKNPIYYVMTKKVIVANIDSKFSHVQELFMDYEASHLPVMDGEVLVGIISDHDIMRAYAQTLAKNGSITKDHLDDVFRVEDWMTPNPVVLASEDPISMATEILAERRFEALPIVDNGELVGIVTNKDLVSFLNQVYEAR
jgi:CBS domain-containing protein